MTPPQKSTSTPITTSQKRDYGYLATLFAAWLYDTNEAPTQLITIGDDSVHGWYVDHWQPVSGDQLARLVRTFLDSLRVETGDGTTGYRPTIAAVWEVVAAVRHNTPYHPHLYQGETAWIDRPDGYDDDPGHYLTLADGQLLHWPTGTLAPAVPALWCGIRVHAVWLPAQSEPPSGLARIIRDQWGDDTETVTMLRRIIGVAVTRQTHLEQVCAMVGQPRSGKSAIASAIAAILGDHATVTSTYDLTSEFGLAGMIGRSCVIVNEARMRGASFDRAVDRLLSITGGDKVDVNRKNREAVTARIDATLLWVSNEVPRVQDETGAVASRFAFVHFPASCVGRADPTVKQQVVAQRSELFSWAIQGAQEVYQGQPVTTPAASQQLVADVQAVTSPITTFVDECYTITGDMDAYVPVQAVYDTYRDWCVASGIQPKAKAHWGIDMATAMPHMAKTKRRIDGKRVMCYAGLTPAT